LRIGGRALLIPFQNLVSLLLINNKRTTKVCEAEDWYSAITVDESHALKAIDGNCTQPPNHDQ
jgi:hypothetical protein